MSQTLKYRPEVDGLRAVAVLAVMLFHAKIPGFPGGFVGVDVFFVISGYLITGILLRELDSDSFSIVAFYERRVRRILPALFLVLLACIPLGWFLMSPYDFQRLGQGMMAVIAFVSNILFWRTTDYFADTADNPLLHTWSLGVEEQFYIFFPLFLWCVWRYARGWLAWAMVLAAAVSLAISAWWVQSGWVVPAFYLIPTRAFELLLGALLAGAALRGRLPDPGEKISGALAWAGLGAIVWAVAMFSKDTPFPGWHALAPAAGAALVLAFVRADSVLGRLLSWRAMVGVGLISYSAYLWHQPVFAFSHLAGWKPGLAASLGLIAASLLLAWLSWRYVEHPFRNRARMSRRAVFGWAGVVSAGLLGCGAWLVATGGVASRYTAEELQWWRYADVDLQSDYVTRRFQAHAGAFTPDAKRKVLLMGDSYAQDFANMAHEAGAWHDAQVRTVYVPAICQMVDVEEDVSEHIAPIDRPVCADAPSVRSSMSLIGQADIVVLAASWKEWSARLLPRTISHMGLRADQRLFVIGPKHYPPVDIRKLLARGDIGRAARRVRVPEGVSKVNRLLAMSLPPDVFVDQIHIVCGPDEQCPAVTGRDKLISYDGGHLTRAGAAYIGKKLFAESALADVR
ncbi:acyltransferase family protein [uncultured Castellaniella sp.]|uniref:acyltransferase family protein n=1 Tax=uncultured Castellaniella sp. TaxID=647907 RepID=UPI0026380B2D|nr:acyltransferase family protein [uncultured Castellaniella sp.]